MRRFIFFWFLAVGLLSLIGAAWIGRSMKVAAADFYESDVSNYAETVAHVLDDGGVASLHDVERRLDPKGKLRVFVFDPDLNQASGDPAPEAVRALATSLRPQ